MWWFCKHDWTVIDKTVLPSGLEQMKELSGVKATGLCLDGFHAKAAATTVACTKCGKLKVVHVRTPISS